jgi:type IV pilus assembly protein PilV
MKKPHSGNQRGTTLLEVMIAIVVLSIGLLGLAGLQVQGLRNIQVAGSHAQAAMLANELVERIHLNADDAADYVGLTSASCNGSTLARRDYCAVLAKATGGDINSDGTISGGEVDVGDMLLRKTVGVDLISVAACGGCTASGMHTITISWTEQGVDGNDQPVTYGYNFRP